jgi:CRP-like cAMP-binding protein/predicted GNAT family N-acyltransferase
MSAVVKQALTHAEREAIFRLRYEIYVLAQNQHAESADHARRQLYDDDDASARLYYVEDEGEVSGTVRVHWGGDAPFSPGMSAPYDFERFAGVVPRERMMVLTRFMVRADRRGGPTALALMIEATRFGHAAKVELAFCDCQPHLLRLYTSMGLRTYKPTYNHPTSGLLVPLVLVASDVEYLRAIRSPLLAAAPDAEHQAELSARIAPCISTRPPLLRREDSTAEDFFAELGDTVRERVNLFEGLDPAQRDRLLAQSHILECQPGDGLIRAGQITRTLYLVLRGALEVRERDELVAVATEGEILGEVAFLMGGRRMADVRVAAQGARVLALSESVLRQLLDDDARLAARLLLNLAKAVCAKLQQRSAGAREG